MTEVVRRNVGGRLILGHDEDGENVLGRVRKRWDLDRVFPRPLWNPSCPCCDVADSIIRRYDFFKSEGSRSGIPWRVDVHMKCRECSLAYVFGIPIPEELFRFHAGDGKRGTVRYLWADAAEAEDELSERFRRSYQKNEGSRGRS